MEIKRYRSIDMAATGRNIAELRRTHGYSVADLQHYFGFDAPQAIYKWQRGQSIPSTDNLYALSYLLGVSMEEILVPIRSSTYCDESQDNSCGSFSYRLYSISSIGVDFHILMLFIFYSLSSFQIWFRISTTSSMTEAIFCDMLSLQKRQKGKNSMCDSIRSTQEHLKQNRMKYQKKEDQNTPSATTESPEKAQDTSIPESDGILPPVENSLCLDAKSFEKYLDLYIRDQVESLEEQEIFGDSFH